MIEEIARRTGVAVQSADDRFEAELARLPLAQKRTSTSKAYVRVGTDAITKGPYPGSSLCLLNNLRDPHLIALLEEELELPPGCRGVYLWQTLHACPTDAGPRYYLSGPNVGNPARIAVVSASTAVDPEFTVVERETLLRRVSEVEKEKTSTGYRRSPDLDEQIAVASLQHVYLRHLFNVGDSGTHNILIREDRQTTGRPIAGIDFDEHRREQEGNTIWDCLFKKGYPYLETVYGDFLARVKLVPHELSEALQVEIEALNALSERWAQDLPKARRPEAVLRPEDVVRRAARLRALMPSTEKRPD
jgi:hypothetical protein